MFQSEDIEIVDIPYQAPNANAYAERWVRSVREECLDHLIILNEHHLRRILMDGSKQNDRVGRRPILVHEVAFKIVFVQKGLKIVD